MNEENKPKGYDLVLGGNNPPPVDGLVLGGIAGIKRRLESNNTEIIKSALSDAISYKDEGLELVINALYNTPQEIRQHAVKIIRNYKTAKAEQALLDYDPNSLFVRFSDWNLKDFNLESYLDDPVNTAYRVDLKQFKNIISELEKIEPQGSKIEALYLPMWEGRKIYRDPTSSSVSYEECIDLLLDAHQQLPNLKALFLADDTSDSYVWGSRSDYKRYKIYMEEVCYLPEAYPKLEVLRLQGRDGLKFSSVKHNLKTLIIEARELGYRTLKQVLSLDLPHLEYLELWLGADNYIIRRWSEDGDIFNYGILTPLFCDNCFPNLKYLGLCSCECTNTIVEVIKDSPLIENLRILNLTRGTLTDEGAEILLNCPAINRLHTLDVSMNLLSSEMVDKLSQLDCNVIAEPQDIDSYNEDCGRHRYSALYE